MDGGGPGHLVWMEEGRLPNKVQVMKHPGHGKRDRPQLRWEDCIKKDVRKAKEADKWREKAVSREKWKGLTVEVMQQYVN